MSLQNSYHGARSGVPDMEEWVNVTVHPPNRRVMIRQCLFRDHRELSQMMRTKGVQHRDIHSLPTASIEPTTTMVRVVVPKSPGHDRTLTIELDACSLIQWDWEHQIFKAVGFKFVGKMGSFGLLSLIWSAILRKGILAALKSGRPMAVLIKAATKRFSFLPPGGGDVAHERAALR
jgi:hypothetical protein